MALLRTAPSPIRLFSPLALPSSRLPALLLSSAQNSTHLDVFLGAPRVAKAQWPAAGVRLRSKVCCTRASVGEDRRDDSKLPRNLPLGEMQYLGKLSAGCVAGAFLVKYGSLCVPSITSPNINLAFLMIFSPVVASIVLLALASILSSDGNKRKQ